MLQTARNHYIPVSRADLIRELQLRAPQFDIDGELFGQIARQVMALYHYRFHERAEYLKACYEPFIPDGDFIDHPIGDDPPRQLRDLRTGLQDLLQNGNYRKLTVEEINWIMTQLSNSGVRVTVDLDQFDELLVFVRGQGENHHKHRDWRKLWLSEKEEVVKTFHRLFIMFRLNPERRPGPQTKLEKFFGWLEGQPPTPPISAHHLHLRFFKDIPQDDLEMLFPNCDVRMKPFDKIKLAITGGGGTAGGLVATGTKLLAAVNPVALMTAAAGIAGLLWRQLSKVMMQRHAYMARLAQHLYFHNLASNLGAVNRMVDMAEEEECKEALLALYCLMRHGGQSLTAEQLDQCVQQQLQDWFDVTADFDAADALEKLKYDRLATKNADGVWSALSSLEAQSKLRELWADLEPEKLRTWEPAGE